MNRRLLFKAGVLSLVLCTSLCSGCVERRYLILTDVPGTIVLENNKYVGPAPADRPFQFYGKYRFTLLANGYDPKIVDECISMPWYEYLGLDFISENLLPFWIRDRRTFTYKLDRTPVVPPEVVKARAEDLRFKAKDIGVPLPGAVPPPGAILVPPGTVPPVQGPPPVETAPPPARLLQPTNSGAVPPTASPPVVPTAVPVAPREQPTPTWTPGR